MRTVSAWAAPYVEPEEYESPRNVTPGHGDAWLKRAVNDFRDDAAARAAAGARGAKLAAAATLPLFAVGLAHVPILSGVAYLATVYCGVVVVYGWCEWRIGTIQAALDCTYEQPSPAAAEATESGPARR